MKYCMTVKYRIGQDKARTIQDRLVMNSRTVIYRTGQIRTIKYCSTGRITLEW